MSIARRNPETGQIQTNGNKIGAAIEWLRWISQVILIPFMVFCFWWGASVQRFVWQGDRQTASMSITQHVAMEQKWEALFQGLPPNWFVKLQDQKYEMLVRDVEEIQQQDKENHEEILDRLKDQSDRITRLEALILEAIRGGNGN